MSTSEVVAIVAAILGPIGSVIAIIVGLKNIAKSNRDERRARELEAQADAKWRTTVDLKLDGLSKNIDSIGKSTSTLATRVDAVEREVLIHGKRIEDLEKRSLRK